MSVDMVSRFEERFIPEPNSGCWLWTASVSMDGYGQFWYARRKRERAPRMAWALYKGPIPKGAFILHKCDTPLCVNPNHLRVGSAKENAQDMVLRKRGKQPVMRGVDNPLTKLTPQDVKEIRRRRATESCKSLAKEYGVHTSQISRIANRLRQGGV
jgi:hypothetical protein